MSPEQNGPTTRLRPSGRSTRPPRLMRSLVTTGNQLPQSRSRGLTDADTSKSGAAADCRSAGLPEWHAMTAVEQRTTWVDLVDWVIWLHDRYELSVEEKLPVCWAEHPGLIEELRALKVWRQEIYLPTRTDAGQQQTATAVGQAARYWHGELRQVLHAASTQYAAGCRAAHRSATSLADSDADLHARWLDADPAAGIPTTLAASASPHGTGIGTTIGGQLLREALDRGDAQPLGDTVADYIHYDGTWWMREPATTRSRDQRGTDDAPGSHTHDGLQKAAASRATSREPPAVERWHQVTDSTFSSDLDRAATALRQADDAVQQHRPGGDQPRP